MTSILPTLILLCLTKPCICIFSLSKARIVNEDILLATIALQVISGELSFSVHCLPEYHATAYNAKTGCTVAIRTLVLCSLKVD